MTSSWYCAGGTAEEEGLADHVATAVNTDGQGPEAELDRLPGIVTHRSSTEPRQLDPYAPAEGEPEAEREEEPSEDGGQVPVEVVDVPDEPISATAWRSAPAAGSASP